MHFITCPICAVKASMYLRWCRRCAFVGTASSPAASPVASCWTARSGRRPTSAQWCPVQPVDWYVRYVQLFFDSSTGDRYISEHSLSSWNNSSKHLQREDLRRHQTSSNLKTHCNQNFHEMQDMYIAHHAAILALLLCFLCLGESYFLSSTMPSLLSLAAILCASVALASVT